MFEDRKMIRDNRFLNKLLYDNNNGLLCIYELYKDDQNMFTLDSANKLFLGMDHDDYSIDSIKVRESFILSIMTIHDETKPQTL